MEQATAFDGALLIAFMRDPEVELRFNPRFRAVIWRFNLDVSN